ncbi:hypothetical protein [Williamsia herbipolensis]|uniref:hypothetical protein n=1 Tax=Williamsia herbipolensis TaxID=1603258 RepID=UPI000B2E4C70|nr:hypothetical protein [Williamsia herbipolensis]
MTLPRITCPDCGYVYPVGTVALGGEVLDPVVESGGRSSHPAHCERSEAPRTGGSSQGLYQQIPSTWK